MTRGRVAAVFALAAVAPLFLSAGGNVLHNMVLAAAYVVMALGLNVIVGFAGLLDLGYVACFAIGAYTTAYFASGYWGIHLNFLLVLALAVATTAIVGTLIGVPTLRLRGDYIAVVTLAFGEIISQIAANGRQIELFGGTLTPGPIGIGPIDDIELPLLGSFGTLDLRPWYWFALALVALALMVNVHLRDSRIGRAWTAMRDDETAAAYAGIPIVRTKLAAYGTGAAFGGVAGAFFASYLGVVNASQFEFSFSIFIFAHGRAGAALGSISGRRGLGAIAPLAGQQLAAARRPLRRPPAALGPGLRPVGDQLRHLRRDPRLGDAVLPPPQGLVPAPRRGTDGPRGRDRRGRCMSPVAAAASAERTVEDFHRELPAERRPQLVAEPLGHRMRCVADRVAQHAGGGSGRSRRIATSGRGATSASRGIRPTRPCVATRPCIAP